MVSTAASSIPIFILVRELKFLKKEISRLL